MANAAGASQPGFLLIGEILRPHGVHGELKVRVLTEYPERIPRLPAVYAAASATASNPRPLHVESMRMHQGFALLRFREAPDRTQAERLRGLMLMVRLEDAVPLAEGEFYLYQVIGLSVRTVDGLELGTLTEVLETGANDVYIVNGGPFGEVLIPVTPDTIVETDIPGGRLIVRLPDGLLPSPSEGDEPD